MGHFMNVCTISFSSGPNLEQQYTLVVFGSWPHHVSPIVDELLHLDNRDYPYPSSFVVIRLKGFVKPITS